MAERRIAQIMPAVGWAAVFDEGGEEVITPLVGWALVEGPDGNSTVVGLVGWEHVEMAEQQPNFARYVFMTDMFLTDEGEDFDDEDLDEDFEDDEEDGETYDPKAGRLN